MNEKTQQQVIAEQATGCRGAGNYAIWAEQQGYPHCAVVDWTSSAGDWCFLVSEDGQLWFMMFQTNNYPQGPGFTRTIDTDQMFEGTEQEVLEQVSNCY